jgi:hypothetical protein
MIRERRKKKKKEDQGVAAQSGVAKKKSAKKAASGGAGGAKRGEKKNKKSSEAESAFQDADRAADVADWEAKRDGGNGGNGGKPAKKTRKVNNSKKGGNGDADSVRCSAEPDLSAMRVRTTNRAVEILESYEPDIAGVKAKALSLPLALMGIAEDCTRRAARMSPLMVDIEDKIFTEKPVDLCTSEELMHLYRMGSKSLEFCAAKIHEAYVGVDLASLEDGLLGISRAKELQEEQQGPVGDDEAMVHKLLEALSLQQQEEEAKEAARALGGEIIEVKGEEK